MLACKLTHIFETASFMDVINESSHTIDVPLPRKTNEHTTLLSVQLDTSRIRINLGARHIELFPALAKF